MGFGYTVKCKRCKYKETYYLGAGMEDDFYTIYKAQHESFFFKRKGLKTIRELVQYYNGYLEETPGYELFMCKRCKRIQEKLYFRIIHDNGIYAPAYQCRCGLPLLPLSLDGGLGGIPCPKCGRLSLTEDHECDILWD
jgi:hypothetical protein